MAGLQPELLIMTIYATKELLAANSEAAEIIESKLKQISKLYEEIEYTASLAGFQVGYKGPAGKGDSGTFYPAGTYDWNDRYYYGGVKRAPDFNTDPLWMPSSQEGC
ncbi:hypothetical protein [Stenotrophomonas phage YB07]|uniref:Uncharacterized protein n=2 Tax=Menderavirus TaxID=2843421 RepID=A0A482IHS3_9CAUD|nr:hypothetical protein HWC11_gp095 [Stenotrophomonas phage YB07]QBP06291.1 hypothetical protein [Stenotrophomonas phage YB07]